MAAAHLQLTSAECEFDKALQRCTHDKSLKCVEEVALKKAAVAKTRPAANFAVQKAKATERKHKCDLKGVQKRCHKVAAVSCRLAIKTAEGCVAVADGKIAEAEKAFKVLLARAASNAATERLAMAEGRQREIESLCNATLTGNAADINGTMKLMCQEQLKAITIMLKASEHEAALAAAVARNTRADNGKDPTVYHEYRRQDCTSTLGNVVANYSGMQAECEALCQKMSRDCTGFVFRNVEGGQQKGMCDLKKGTVIVSTDPPTDHRSCYAKQRVCFLPCPRDHERYQLPDGRDMPATVGYLQEGETVDLTCEHGYELKPEVVTYKCIPDDEGLLALSPSPDSVINVLQAKCQPQFCALPPLVRPHQVMLKDGLAIAEFGGEEVNEEVEPDSVIKISCAPGFEPENEASAVYRCTRLGTLQPEPEPGKVKCVEAKKCDDVSFPLKSCQYFLSMADVAVFHQDENVTQGNCTQEFSQPDNTKLQTALRISSSSEVTHSPKCYNYQLDSEGAWCFQESSGLHILQIEFDRPSRVRAVGTQGMANEPNWVTSFRMAFSVDGETFTDPIECGGNKNQDTVVWSSLTKPEYARFMQIQVTGWHGKPALRLGVAMVAPAKKKPKEEVPPWGLDGGIRLRKGWNLTSSFCTSDQFSLRFEIFPLRNDGGGWQSIIHFTTGGDDCGAHQRIPALFFHPFSTRLRVRMSNEDNCNAGCDPIDELELNVWTPVEIILIEDTLRVLIAGNEVCTNTRFKGRVSAISDQVQIWAGSQFDPAAHARIRNIEYTGHGTDWTHGAVSIGRQGVNVTCTPDLNTFSGSTAGSGRSEGSTSSTGDGAGSSSGDGAGFSAGDRAGSSAGDGAESAEGDGAGSAAVSDDSGVDKEVPQGAVEVHSSAGNSSSQAPEESTLSLIQLQPHIVTEFGESDVSIKDPSPGTMVRAQNTYCTEDWNKTFSERSADTALPACKEKCFTTPHCYGITFGSKGSQSNLCMLCFSGVTGGSAESIGGSFTTYMCGSPATVCNATLAAMTTPRPTPAPTLHWSSTNSSVAAAAKFKELDTNGDGSVTTSELEKAFRDLELLASAVAKLMGQLDTDRDGQVSESEFRNNFDAWLDVAGRPSPAPTTAAPTLPEGCTQHVGKLDRANQPILSEHDGYFVGSWEACLLKCENTFDSTVFSYRSPGHKENCACAKTTVHDKNLVQLNKGIHQPMCQGDTPHEPPYHGWCTFTTMCKSPTPSPTMIPTRHPLSKICNATWEDEPESGMVLQYPHILFSGQKGMSLSELRGNTVYMDGPEGPLPKRSVKPGLWVYGLPATIKGICVDDKTKELPNGEGTKCNDRRACQQWCDIMPKCNAYTFKSVNKMCSLSHLRDMKSTSAGGTTSRKKCKDEIHTVAPTPIPTSYKQGCAGPWNAGSSGKDLLFPHVAGDTQSSGSVYQYGPVGNLSLGNKYSLPAVVVNHCAAQTNMGQGTSCAEAKYCKQWCAVMPKCHAFSFSSSGHCSLSYRTELTSKADTTATVKCEERRSTWAAQKDTYCSEDWGNMWRTRSITPLEQCKAKCRAAGWCYGITHGADDGVTNICVLCKGVKVGGAGGSALFTTYTCTDGNKPCVGPALAPTPPPTYSGCVKGWRSEKTGMVLQYLHASDGRTANFSSGETVYKYGPDGTLGHREGPRIDGVILPAYELPPTILGLCSDNKKIGEDSLPTGQGTKCNDVNACQAWCRVMPKCNGFSFRGDTKMCSLSARTPLITGHGYTSRLKCAGAFPFLIVQCAIFILHILTGFGWQVPQNQNAQRSGIPKQRARF